MKRLLLLVAGMFLASNGLAVRAQVAAASHTFELVRTGYAKETYMAMKQMLDASATVVFNDDANTIKVDGTAEQVALARKIVADIESAPQSSTQQSVSSMVETGVRTRARFFDVPEQTFYLKGATPERQKEVVAKLRAVPELKAAKVYWVPSQSAVVMRASEQGLALVRIVLTQEAVAFQSSTLLPAIDPGSGADGVGLWLQTFYLRSVDDERYAREVLVALRNMLDPSVRVFLVQDMSAIVLEGWKSELVMAKKVVDDLDPARDGATQ